MAACTSGTTQIDTGKFVQTISLKTHADYRLQPQCSLGMFVGSHNSTLFELQEVL